MSGTDHAKGNGWAGPQPVFVLVDPQMGENIGAGARAMLNFGLEHMRLVNPRDGWPNPKAEAMASGAARVLDGLLVTSTTKEALKDMNFVFATTARSRDLTKTVMTPERAMEHARDLIGQGQKVAVLFGPERSGLANEDIVLANAVISVPVNPAFASLNLAQSILLTSYEWHRQADKTPPKITEMAGAEFAKSGEVEALVQRLDTSLDALNFFWPKDKAQSMRLSLRNMISRMPLTQPDVRMFHGIIKTLSEKTRPKD